MSTISKFGFRGLLAAALCLFAGVAQSATNAKGSNMKNPLSMKAGQSMSVTLVNEYDPDIKENLDTGVCYIKITLSKWNPYTVWIQGGDTAEIWTFSVNTNWEDENAPMAAFDYEDKNDGATQIAYLRSDDWSDDDPASGTYYIWLMGDIGQRTTVSFVNGIHSFAQEGEDGNPRRVNVTELIQRESRTQVDNGDFYYVMNLEAGRKYRLWAVGSTQPVAIETTQEADLSPQPDTDVYNAYFASMFPGYSSENGVAYVLYPSVSGDYVFNISTRSGASQGFGILYQAFRKRLPEDHADKVLLEEAGNYEADIMPGRENSDGVTYYDNVIDETLCKIQVAKGDRWVFETTGATNSVLMRVYSADGTIVAENETKGLVASFDVRAAVQAAYDGAYYVGVCQKDLLYSDEPDANYRVRIKAQRAEDFSGPGDSDAFDDGDDAYTGASDIVAYPGTAAGSVVETGVPHGPHVLSGRDWYDWFRFAGRGGITYRLKASWAGEETTDLALRAQVYKMVNGVPSVVTPSFGSLTPGDDTAALAFTADQDAMYYVGVSVAEPLPDGSTRNAVGLDFPAYNIHAVGYVNGLDLGLLSVVSFGADGEWTLDDQLVADQTRFGSVRFAGGSTALVVANGLPARVNFQPVDGFKTPRPEIVYPSAGLTEDVFGFYEDTMDPKDDSNDLAEVLAGGYTFISPLAQSVSLARTLWEGDPVDTYVFRAEEGRSYSFVLKDTTESHTGGIMVSGDAEMAFLAYAGGKLVPVEGLDGVMSVEKRFFDPGYVVLKVQHSSEPGFELGSCYTLSHKSVNIGAISFANPAVVVSKGDAYADLVLRRSASEGNVSVRYATVEWTAKPGEDYYPTTSEQTISWADGDSSDKTIRVRLIPSLYDEWTEDREFMVRISVFDADSVSDEEYIPAISGEEVATVTIKSAVAENPGTVELLDQPLQVTAGHGTFSLRLARTGGANGRIAVALYSRPGTATAGVDYENITYTVVEWADGESGVKEVPFTTHDTGAASAKTVDIGMLAVNADYRAAGYGDYRDCLIPTVATPSTVLSIVGNVARETGTLLSAAAEEGVSISTPIGSWYSDGTLRSGDLSAGSSARIGFTVVGPGFLKVDPQVVGGAGSMIYLVGSGSVQDCPDLGAAPMVLTVPAGRQTVLFQINAQGGDVHAEFATVDNGLPFKWMPLSTIAADGPISGAVVPAYGVPLSWTAPRGWNKEDVWYRVKLGVAPTAVPYKASGETTALSAAITEPVVASYITNTVSNLAVGKSARFYWTVECAYSDDIEPDFASLAWITAPGVWNFAVSGEGTPRTLVSGFDAMGAAVAEGSVVELVEGVRFEADLALEGYVGTISGCVGGKLPPGLSAAGLKISGVPSKAGTYRALVEAGIGAAYGTTTELVFHVAEAGTALGSLGGHLAEDGSAGSAAALRNLLLTFSATAGGSIAARVNYYAGSLAFSTENGYAEFDPETSNATVRLTSPVTYDGISYENSVELSVRCGSLEDPENIGREVGDAAVTLWIRDASGVPTERTYVCGALARYDADSEVFVEAMKGFAGYYTFALAPVGPLAGEPSGNGVVTMTLSDAGVARFAGTLADGTTFSMASYVNLVGDIATPGAYTAAVPFWASAASYSLGGTVKVVCGPDGAYVRAFSEIEWSKDGASSTYDGAGFRLQQQPVGGWYDTVANLHRWYLDMDFTVETEPVTGIPAYLRHPGVSYVADTTPHGVAVTIDGQELVPEPTRFAMEEGGRRFDLSNSDNPWGVKLAFNRGSGLVTGTFAVISDNGSSPQSYAATLNHTGVLLMNCDPVSPFVDCLTAGFYLMPSSKSGWMISRPFNIRATSADRDWSEAELH